jgi:hypothetical protein
VLAITFGKTYIFSAVRPNFELINFFFGVLAMEKTFTVILGLMFSLVASSAWAWSRTERLETDGYFMVDTPANQDNTMQAQDIQESTIRAIQDRTMRTQNIQITDVVERGNACPENGRMARDAEGEPLFCKSGVWKSVGRPNITVRTAIGELYSSRASGGTAWCAESETVIAGGAHCKSRGGLSFLNHSHPEQSGNGWYAACGDIEPGEGGQLPITIWAMCAS